MSNADIFVGELIGTAILILFGAGVCAAVTLNKSKARGAGWVVIAFGWGFGVLAGAYTSAPLSGGQINPAVTIGFAIEGSTKWEDVPFYILGQFAGAIIGAVLCWLLYLGQFNLNAEEDQAIETLGIFSTRPEINNPVQNLITEIIATVALMLPILAMVGGDKHVAGIGDAGLPVLLIALLVVGIGLSLGGPTGYAINPARDLGPRLTHALLPIPNKGTSEWSYSWIPVVGPIAGAAIGALIYNAAF
ncbi:MULTISPECIES: MIP/aquaporin family protein [unclassified Streptomyces]|uniref:MIP/aquaporin family protein n=1 Tax=unclassified Streptomyces TaxID=2593676 RepID=UPI00225A3D81|nr:MIP/aquaporin family protein [Streptomyces sp. NBC_00620]MCX4976159.1 aquaporin family protein [Streptomyces sp. NBC_00620]WUC09702.1 aquaporin family protein [Streptomyces sp. NBC_00564]WUC53796.1 aquaporin family protein [Streptomyces sp. NBC_00554]